MTVAADPPGTGLAPARLAPYPTVPSAAGLAAVRSPKDCADPLGSAGRRPRRGSTSPGRRPPVSDRRIVLGAASSGRGPSPAGPPRSPTRSAPPRQRRGRTGMVGAAGRRPRPRHRTPARPGGPHSMHTINSRPVPPSCRPAGTAARPDPPGHSGDQSAARWHRHGHPISGRPLLQQWPGARHAASGTSHRLRLGVDRVHSSRVAAWCPAAYKRPRAEHRGDAQRDPLKYRSNRP